MCRQHTFDPLSHIRSSYGQAVDIELSNMMESFFPRGAGICG
jgi:hypothetical protein